MANKLQWTARARKSFREIPGPDLGRQVHAKIKQIGDDPEGMTSGVTLGTRANDGMMLASGSTYYYQVQFAHMPGSDTVTILQIQVMSVSGPH